MNRKTWNPSAAPETIEPVVYSVDLLSRHDPYYPMVQGEATSRLAMTATRNMAINPITGDAVIEDEGFRAFFEGYDGLKIGLTVGAQKLLSTAALYLTQNNHYRGCWAIPSMSGRRPRRRRPKRKSGASKT